MIFVFNLNATLKIYISKMLNKFIIPTYTYIAYMGNLWKLLVIKYRYVGGRDDTTQKHIMHVYSTTKLQSHYYIAPLVELYPHF